jgi:MoxR-like ATPase
MHLEAVREQADAILDELERAVVGKRDALELILAALLCDGHVLLEDYPGLAKTLIARSFAQASSLRFSRIQFTPDLMPSDVTGSSVFDQRRVEFTFLPGPIFTNLLLADEINRAPPKTQAALLEAMQERQVTTEGETRTLEPPFLVIATQNPIEYEGKRSSTASSSASVSAIRAVSTRRRCSRDGWTAARTRWSYAPSSIQRRSWRCNAPSSACTCPRRSADTSSTS